MVQQLLTANIVIIISFGCLGTIFCIARLLTRLLFMKVSWTGLMRWSDICMLIAWLFSVTETVAMCKVTILGHFGYHAVDAEKMPTDYVLLCKWMMVNSLAYNPILSFVKASMILLYLRLGGAKAGVRLWCYIMLAFNVALAISIFMADLLQCMPIEYSWNSMSMDAAAQLAAGATEPGITAQGPVSTGFKNGVYVKGGRCFHQVEFLMICAGLTILTDLLILCIPIYMVYNLQMKAKKKAVVILILCLGLGVTAVGLVRLVFQWQVFHPTSLDSMYYSTHSTISQIETGLALVTGCVPELFPMPNPYPYGSGSGSTYSQRIRKVITPFRASNASNPGMESDEMYTMNTFNWRGDGLHPTEVQVKGGAENGSLTRSQEAIIDGNVEHNEGIVKTTHFVVQEADLRAEEKRWSNV